MESKDESQSLTQSLEFGINASQRSASVVDLDPQSSMADLTVRIPQSPHFRNNKPFNPKNNGAFRILTQSDKRWIVLYNLIEPLLLALIITTSMELSQMGTVIYMFVAMSMLLPMLLTKNLDFI